MQVAVVLFYDKVMVDPILAPFFAGYDLKDQVIRHIAFMTKAFGGEVASTDNLTPAHLKLVNKGLNGTHVDRFIELMSQVLSELEVSEADTSAVVTRLESARGRVLGQP